MVKNLRLLRTKNNISQQQLAEIIGVTQQSINKYENHKIEPDIQTLIKLAEYFNTSVDYLIGHTDIDHVIETVVSYDLNREEAILIEYYRRLSKKQKHAVSILAESYFD
ncbi:MAG: helix-turn-helix transcriptional regulator [Clostridia bacterium]|nr:helix-turn-helix transcriptional regulator [Clostridia bacterium]MBR2175778.1 helix-turn-helix transcriptional regulator [Clostridia bacterium]